MEINGKVIIILRHGQPGNRVHPQFKPNYPIPEDPALSRLGHVQSARSAELLMHLFPGKSCKIISSPFLSCMQTAEKIAVGFETDVDIDWRLSDFIEPLTYAGDISQFTYETDWFREKASFIFTERNKEKPAFPEKYEAMKERANACFQEYKDRDADIVVFVTHMFLLEVLTSQVKGQDVRLTDDGYGALTIAVQEPEGYSVKVQADYTHAPQYE